MSSKKFYEHLGNWDKILSKSLQHSDSSGCSDGSTGDGVQDFAHENDDSTADPQDADNSNVWDEDDAENCSFFDVFEFGVNDDDMIGEVDADINSYYRRGTGDPNNTSSGRRTPDTSLNSADRSERCGRTASVMVNPANNSTLACRATKDHNKVAECEVGSFALSTRRNGDIDVLKLPANKKRNTTRKSMKQIQLVPAPRKAIISWPNISVQLSDLLRWAKVTPDLSFVKRILDAYPRAMTDAFLFGREPVCRRELVCPADFEYNFVVPIEIARTMERVLNQEREQTRRRNQLRSINNEEHSQRHTELIVSYGELRKKFTRQAVFRLTNFYSISRICTAWEKDVNWLSMSWNQEENGEVELFSLESHINSGREGGRDRGCADDIIVKYKSASFQTAFMLPSGNFSVTFNDVVGSVARNCFLTDTVIQMCLQYLCDLRDGCRVFESSFGLASWPSTPTIQGQRTPTGDEIVENLSLMKYLVYPCNISCEHWTLLVAKVDFKEKISVFLYDPIGKYETETEREWDHGCIHLFSNGTRIGSSSEWSGIQNRASNNQPTLPLLKLPKVKKEMLRNPIQPDGASCGVMILAQAYALVNNVTRFNTKRSVSMSYVRSMRLRTLWLLLCYSNEQSFPQERRASCKGIQDQLLKYFG
ncbi:hypothetical protein GN244_ATG12060 [Phytophthora infestans]|uniref:Ubiquitin-like protease family profile domain-containing protein n=1 Tax=Phytophthora infestans TaxID=4787 RepID=A0A833WBC3_PHYIN|nr:hypothetical protein GN244_ATG12060 [Phytophthora infestans]